MATGKTLEAFEAVHGGPKIDRLQRELATERAKVEALADVQNRVHIETRDDCHLQFAVVGDRHVGSLYHHAAAIQAFYDYAEQMGADVVLDAGDILDGHRVYKGQEFELRDIGFEAQLDRLEQDAPKNLPTQFITGNHDASFKNAAGICVGKSIEARVPGYGFLGEEQATISYSTPNGAFTIMLMHPGGGSAYALSYRPQKLIESLEGGTKPNMLIIGHYHKAEMMPSYRNVCALQPGTFQRQTPFMARQGLAAHVGGWIMDVTVGEDHNTVRGEFVAVYV